MPIQPNNMLLQVAQPFRPFMIDLRRNWRWIIGSAALIALWVFISSYIFSTFEGKSYSLSVYFTIMNMTTGFPDISPATEIGKVLGVINSITGLVVFGILVAVITLALQPSENANQLLVFKGEEQVTTTLLTSLNALLDKQILERRIIFNIQNEQDKKVINIEVIVSRGN